MGSKNYNNIFRKKRIYDLVSKVIITLLSLIGIIMLFFIILFISLKSSPALREVGFWNFITNKLWIIDNASNFYQFGALAFIVGTLLLMMISMLMAVPLAIFSSIFIVEFLSKRIQRVVIFILELLSGIPPVVFALFGLNTIGQIFKSAGANSPNNLMTAAVILAFMALPTILALTCNALKAVPESYRFASYGMGVSKVSTSFKVVKKSANAKIVGATIFGVCRVVGEVTAMTLLTGLTAKIPDLNNGFLGFIFSSISTLTTQIGLELPEHVQEIHASALFALGLILLILVSILNIIILMTYKISNSRKKGAKWFTNIRKIFHSKRNKKYFWNNLKNKIFKRKSARKLNENQIIVLLDQAYKYNYWNKFIDWIRMSLMIIFTIISITFTLWIIGDIILKGLTAMNFINNISSSQLKDVYEIGPLIISTILLVLSSIVFAIPIGIATAIYLNEYAHKESRLAGLIRFSVDALVATPSIVFAMFGYIVFVVGLGIGHSFISAGLMFGIMILPIIIRAVEDSLKNVPDEYRVGSYAIGASKIRTIFTVILPNAKTGIVAGVILAISKIITETAPVILVLTSSQFMPQGFTDRGTVLTVQIFKFISEPSIVADLARQLKVTPVYLATQFAYHLALITMSLIFCLNLIVKIMGINFNGSKSKLHYYLLFQFSRFFTNKSQKLIIYNKEIIYLKQKLNQVKNNDDLDLEKKNNKVIQINSKLKNYQKYSQKLKIELINSYQELIKKYQLKLKTVSKKPIKILKTNDYQLWIKYYHSKIKMLRESNHTKKVGVINGK